MEGHLQLTSQRADLNEITNNKEFLQVNKKYQLSHSKPPEKIPGKDMQMNISLLRERQTEKHPEAFFHLTNLQRSKNLILPKGWHCPQTFLGLLSLPGAPVLPPLCIFPADMVTEA